jgi:hypothetical protein
MVRMTHASSSCCSSACALVHRCRSRGSSDFPSRSAGGERGGEPSRRGHGASSSRVRCPAGTRGAELVHEVQAARAPDCTRHGRRRWRRGGGPSSWQRGSKRAREWVPNQQTGARGVEVAERRVGKRGGKHARVRDLGVTLASAPLASRASEWRVRRGGEQRPGVNLASRAARPWACGRGA